MNLILNYQFIKRGNRKNCYLGKFVERSETEIWLNNIDQKDKVWVYE